MAVSAKQTRALLGLAEDATDGQVAARRAQIAALPPPGVAASTARPSRRGTSERDRVISAAIAAGRFSESRRPFYEDRWAADPEGTRVLLTAAPEEGGLAAVEPESTTPTASSSGVATDPESGLMHYRGYPVAMGAGVPQVFTTSGWMSVDAFKSSDLTDDDLQEALILATAFENARAAQAYREGPK